MLKQLNDTNGAAELTFKCVQECMTRFEGELYAVEMGVAYGGGVERIGKLWKDRGKVWGFDTFEGHPKQIAEVCEYTKQSTGPNGEEAHATSCMNPWYADAENYGTDRIKYEYIRKCLDEQGLDNVTLVKGLVEENTDVSFLPEKIHYALIDLDFPIAQLNGWNLLKNKIVNGGYLCLHDMIPHGHIHGCYEYYQQMLEEGLFDVELEDPSSFMVILKKK